MSRPGESGTVRYLLENVALSQQQLFYSPAAGKAEAVVSRRMRPRVAIPLSRGSSTAQRLNGTYTRIPNRQRM